MGAMLAVRLFVLAGWRRGRCDADKAKLKQRSYEKTRQKEGAMAKMGKVSHPEMYRTSSTVLVLKS